MTGEALVGASRDEVWQLLDDLEGMPRWLPGLRSVTTSGPAHVGTLYRTKTSVFGFERARDWEIVEHRPGHRQVRVARDSSIERTLTLTVDTRGSGTRLRAELTLRSSLGFPLGPAHEAIARATSAGTARALVDAVKRAFEGPRR